VLVRLTQARVGVRLKPHLPLYQLAMSCRTRYSSILDLPVPVEPQMYKCVARISGVIGSGLPVPSTIPSLTVFPGNGPRTLGCSPDLKLEYTRLSLGREKRIIF